MKKRYRRIGLILLGLLLAACGNRGPAVFIPTETPNPMAFFAPTPISPGRPANPLQILFVPPDMTEVGDAPTVLTNALNEASGLTVQVITTESYGVALGVLCDYNDEDRFAAVWLSGPSAILAEAEGCGDIAMRGVRGGSTGLVGEIIASPGIGGSLSNLLGRTFCRIDGRDFYSWVLPTLAFEAADLDPTRIASIQSNYPTYADLVLNVAGGECSAAGVPAGAREDESLSEQARNVTVVYESPPMPYGVLVYPPELLLDDREALTEAFLEIAPVEEAEPDPDETADAGAEATPVATPALELIEVDEGELSAEQVALLNLLGAEAVQVAGPDEFEDVRAFMERTGFVELEPTDEG